MTRSYQNHLRTTQTSSASPATSKTSGIGSSHAIFCASTPFQIARITESNGTVQYLGISQTYVGL